MKRRLVKPSAVWLKHICKHMETSENPAYTLIVHKGWRPNSRLLLLSALCFM